jgi:hypothetical protein
MCCILKSLAQLLIVDNFREARRASYAQQSLSFRAV